MKVGVEYHYPKLPGISETSAMAEMPLMWEYLLEYARMKYEQGADCGKIQALVDGVVDKILETSKELQELPDDPALALCEPNDLLKIRNCRPERQTDIKVTFDEKFYRDKIQGGVIGRFAGCTLGAPVEFWSIEEMRDWAAYCGQAFPPTEYWKKTKRPNELRYEVSRFDEYEQDNLDKVPVDDDVTYTLLNLLVLEEYGLDFTTEQAGIVWNKYLPRACTAEEVVLNHLKNGILAEHAADLENPYAQWLGADIRADAWGYVSPGMPEVAAELAYRDAYLTHRRNGIYGEMYYSAVIAAALTAGSGVEGAPDSMEDALKMGLEQIPKDCLLARDIRWALEKAPAITDYQNARDAVEEYFDGMSGVHTNFNACLTIWGILLGGTDFEKVIGEITAMGYDNDCNAATAGSIFGAFYGMSGIPEKWYSCFNNKVYSYLEGHRCMQIDTVCEKFLDFAGQNITRQNR